MRELIIIEDQNEKEIAYVEKGILKEYYKELNDKKRLEGNIYTGKVADILPGMQAAFVDIGEGKNAFLHIRDILPKKSNVTGNKQEDLEKYKIKYDKLILTNAYDKHAKSVECIKYNIDIMI